MPSRVSPLSLAVPTTGPSVSSTTVLTSSNSVVHAFKDITGRTIMPGDVVAYAVGSRDSNLTIAVVAGYVEKDSYYNHGTMVTKIKLQSPSEQFVYTIYGKAVTDDGLEVSDYNNIIVPGYKKKAIKTTYFTDIKHGIGSRFVILTGRVKNPLDGWNVGQPI